MKKIFIPFLLALALNACHEGNIIPEATDVNGEMSFNVLMPGIQTKVSSGTFETADQIGLYVTDYINETTPMPLQVSGNRANNSIVTFDGAAWTPEQTIYWGNGKSDVYAYYPYIHDIQDVESQYFEVATDQTGDGYEASDLLWAKTEGVKQIDGAVNLQMNHLMSKLTVKIVAGEDYVGSLPDDASVQLHSTVTGARVDFVKASVSKDSYSSAKSIKMKKLGLRMYEGVQAVVYEAIVVPQMLERSVPLLEINSKSVSYLIEDPFNFRPGVVYTYTVTLNTSTTAIKVEIGCELEDWNSASGSDSEDGEEGDESSDEQGGNTYTDLSAAGTANCYLIQGSGNYKFKSVIGNTDAPVGNVKSVEVLWESFGTDERPNVGDLISSVSYKNGYIRFSTPENFRDGNAVIAAKNSKGTILWSWHIWCAEEGWSEQVYANDAGVMMDRNLGATSAVPGNVGALGLMYQWGRKDPFLGSSSLTKYKEALSTGVWKTSTEKDVYDMIDDNPMTIYTGNRTISPFAWDYEKTPRDPCPVGWRVPNGRDGNVWKVAGLTEKWDSVNKGLLFEIGVTPSAWYPAAGYRSGNSNLYFANGSTYHCYYWSCEGVKSSNVFDAYYFGRALSFSFGSSVSYSYCCSVRCQKEE